MAVESKGVVGRGRTDETGCELGEKRKVTALRGSTVSRRPVYACAVGMYIYVGAGDRIEHTTAII